MSDSPFELLSTHRRHLALELLATRERFMTYFRPILTEHGITEQQWRIVRAIASADALTPGEIAQRCVILKPSLTGILVRMEELGWLSRSGDSVDQRRSLVTLTSSGTELHRRIGRDVELRYSSLVAAIGDSEISAIQASLDRFNQAMDRIG